MSRRIILLLLVIVAIAGALAIYLVASTPKTATEIRLPLTARQRSLLERIPASADSFALLPTATLLEAKLEANPVTRVPFAEWSAEQPLPSRWLLGGADVVAWKSGKETSYAIRMDSFRAFLVRIWLMVAATAEARWDGEAFIINSSDHGQRLSAAELDSLLAVGAGLPAGDVLVVQREGGRGVFPPIGRPAVSTLRITRDEIVLVSRAANEALAGRPPVTARFPKGAMLAATFANPPRVVEDLNRLVGARVSDLVGDGGSIALYDVDTGTLLPRPIGVFVLPATPERRAALADLTRVADLFGETRDTGSELLVSFDRRSVPLYSRDTFETAQVPATNWALRIDPVRLIPVLEKLGDSTGLRLATPRLHRAARDLRQWIGALAGAKEIVAVDSIDGGVEELRVRIVSKP